MNARTSRLVARQHAGFLTDYDVLTPQEIDCEPVYRDFLIPRGLGFGVATAIRAPSGDSIILHAERTREQGPVTPDVVARLDPLRKHFARAALISARLELERAKGAVATLEALGLPGAVLKRGGRLLAANAKLVGLVPDVVQDRPSRIGLVDPGADMLLAAAISQLESTSDRSSVGSIPMAARNDTPPMILHVVPICGAAHDVFSSATALLVITPVVPREVPTADLIQGLFDLTPAEARVAEVIGSGLQPGEAASRLGIAEETARTTLKRIFAKTGMHRQAELVALLSGAILPARP